MYHTCPIKFNTNKFRVPQSHVILVDEVLNEHIEENGSLGKGNIVAHYLHKLQLGPLTDIEHEQIKYLGATSESYCVISAAIILRRIREFPIRVSAQKNQLFLHQPSNWQIHSYVSSLIGREFDLDEDQLAFIIGYIHNHTHNGPQIELPILASKDKGLIY